MQVGQAKRRRGEAALAAFLAENPNHERAAACIRSAYGLIDRSVGLQESGIARAMRGAVAGAPADPDRAGWLLALYFRWTIECKIHRVDALAVVDVIGRGDTLAQVDRARRRRKGWAADELRRGLDVYAEMRGWQRAAQAARDGITSP